MERILLIIFLISLGFGKEIICSKIKEAPQIDGKLEEICWKNIKPIEDENFIIKVCYDEKSIYLGIVNKKIDEKCKVYIKLDGKENVISGSKKEIELVFPKDLKNYVLELAQGIDKLSYTKYELKFAEEKKEVDLTKLTDEELEKLAEEQSNDPSIIASVIEERIEQQKWEEEFYKMVEDDNISSEEIINYMKKIIETEKNKLPENISQLVDQIMNKEQFESMRPMLKQTIPMQKQIIYITREIYKEENLSTFLQNIKEKFGNKMMVQPSMLSMGFSLLGLKLPELPTKWEEFNEDQYREFRKVFIKMVTPAYKEILKRRLETLMPGLTKPREETKVLPSQKYLQKLGLKLEESEKGIIVREVIPNSAAEKAKFKKGDIIVKIELEKVKKIDDIVNILEKYSKESIISIEIVRDGNKQKLLLSLKE